MERALASSWHIVVRIFNAALAVLPNLIIGGLVYWLCVSLSKIVGNSIRHIGERANLDITLSHALGTLSAAALNVLGILMAAVIIVPGFKLAHVVAGLSITSLAIGFAFKDILQNFIAGLLLLWQKPFGIGDLIKTTDYEGRVEEIRIRSTHLKTDSGELIIVPNGAIFENVIIIKTAYKTKQSQITIAGNPDLTVEANRKIIKQILESTDEISKSPASEVFLVDIASGNQTFKAQFWSASSPTAISRIIDLLNTRIMDAMYPKKTPA